MQFVHLRHDSVRMVRKPIGRGPSAGRTCAERCPDHDRYNGGSAFGLIASMSRTGDCYDNAVVFLPRREPFPGRRRSYAYGPRKGAQPMKLYAFASSPNCWKVLAVARELSLQIETIRIDLLNGEAKTPSFLAKNPNGRVPVLEHQGFLLWESNAILAYLATQQPIPSLLPSRPRERAEVDRWLYWESITPPARGMEGRVREASQADHEAATRCRARRRGNDRVCGGGQAARRCARRQGVPRRQALHRGLRVWERPGASRPARAISTPLRTGACLPGWLA